MKKKLLAFIEKKIQSIVFVTKIHFFISQLDKLILNEVTKKFG